MVELQLERRFRVVPKCFVATKAQLLIVTERHVAEYRWQIALWRYVAFCRQFLGFYGNVFDTERPTITRYQSHGQAQRHTQYPGFADACSEMIGS
jgi:hypothetical protein